jgi:hypothetical protein
MQLFDEGDRVKDRDDMNRFGTVTLVSSTLEHYYDEVEERFWYWVKWDDSTERLEYNSTIEEVD